MSKTSAGRLILRQRCWLIMLLASLLHLAAAGYAFAQACEKYEHEATRCVSTLRQYGLKKIFWLSERVGTTFELLNNCKHEVSVTAVFGNTQKRSIIPPLEEKSSDAEDASELKRLGKGTVVCDQANCGKIDRIIACSTVPAQMPDRPRSSATTSKPVRSLVVANAEQKVDAQLSNNYRFVGRENADLTGSDIRSMPLLNASECADSCSRDNGCIGYTFDRWNKRCFLKGGVASVRLEPKGYSAWKEGQSPVQSSSSPRVIETYRGRKLSGVQLDVKASDNVNACVVSCRELDQCVGIQFSKAGQCVW